MTPELEVFLAKLQSAADTPEVGLVAADLLCCTPDSKIEVVPSFEETETVQGEYGQDLATRGLVNALANLGVYVRSLGDTTGVFPSFHRLALAAGMKFEEIPCTGGLVKFKYGPCADVNEKALTLWHFKGVAAGAQTLARKAGNIQGNWKLSGKTGDKAKFELTDGKGIFTSESTEARPDVSSVVNMTAVPGILPLTVSIDNYAYNILDFSFEGGNAVDQLVKCSEVYGYGKSEITKKKGKFEFTCYCETGAKLPLTEVLSGGPLDEDLIITWGPVGKKINITCVDPQYKDCKVEQSGNISVWKVSGQLTRNDIAININHDLVPV